MSAHVVLQTIAVARAAMVTTLRAAGVPDAEVVGPKLCMFGAVEYEAVIQLPGQGFGTRLARVFTEAHPSGEAFVHAVSELWDGSVCDERDRQRFSNKKSRRHPSPRNLGRMLADALKEECAA